MPGPQTSPRHPPASRAEAATVVCFDLGGVLIEICRSWPEACAAAEVELRDVPTAFERERETAGEAHQLGRLEDRDYYDRLSMASGHVYHRDEIAAIHHAWTRSEYPGVAGLLSDLAEREDLVLACLSNTNAAHWRRLAPDTARDALEYPSLSRLSIRLASHVLGLAKPDPEIYERARQEFSVPAERIVFFDDLPANVIAAREAGWEAHEVDPHGDPAGQMRSYLMQRELL